MTIKGLIKQAVKFDSTSNRGIVCERLNELIDELNRKAESTYGLDVYQLRKLNSISTAAFLYSNTKVFSRKRYDDLVNAIEVLDF